MMEWVKMAMIVENGWGLRMALSYAGVEEADAWLKHRGLWLWDGVSEGEKQWALMEATETIDRLYIFSGTCKSEAQALAWPRVGARDAYGEALPELPSEIIQATIDLAYTLAMADVIAIEGHLAKIDKQVMVLAHGKRDEDVLIGHTSKPQVAEAMASLAQE